MRRSLVRFRGRVSAGSRGAASWIAGLGLLALTAITDAIPPRIRFGRWNAVMNRCLAFEGGLPSIPATEPLWQESARSSLHPATDMKCLIVAGALDTGGVETVVAALAEGLPELGIRTEVVCSEEGRVSKRLKERGAIVTRLSGEGLARYVEDSCPDVIQLHRIDPSMCISLRAWASRTVSVFHAMESYLDKASWTAFSDFERRGPGSIAVSESVADFFAPRLSRLPTIVPNGVPDPVHNIADRHESERTSLARALGTNFATSDIIVVALQRFSDQKNAAGLVDAFLLAAEVNSHLRLVMAGHPNSWLEVRRADAARRSHPLGRRVHLLGDSDPAPLLLGGDVYALDSFAEGGPVSAVEAAACGLPLVLSDVGFARQLVQTSGVSGRVVPRANANMSQASIASERRRRHQSNRHAFAHALLEVASSPARTSARVPDGFTLQSMVAGHAQVLREVSDLHTARRTR